MRTSRKSHIAINDRSESAYFGGFFDGGPVFHYDVFQSPEAIEVMKRADDIYKKTLRFERNANDEDIEKVAFLSSQARTIEANTRHA